MAMCAFPFVFQCLVLGPLVSWLELSGLLAFQLEVFLEKHTDLANSYKAAYCLGPSLLGIAGQRATLCQRSNTSLTKFSV